MNTFKYKWFFILLVVVNFTAHGATEETMGEKESLHQRFSRLKNTEKTEEIKKHLDDATRKYLVRGVNLDDLMVLAVHGNLNQPRYKLADHIWEGKTCLGEDFSSFHQDNQTLIDAVIWLLARTDGEGFEGYFKDMNQVSVDRLRDILILEDMEDEDPDEQGEIKYRETELSKFFTGLINPQ